MKRCRNFKKYQNLKNLFVPISLLSIFLKSISAEPIVDTQLYTGAEGLTPPSKINGPTEEGELTILREQFFETDEIDITNSGIELDYNDPNRDGNFSQSILFRSGPVRNNKRSPETSGTIVFPAGITVLGIVPKANLLDTDKTLGLAPDVNYTASARGMEASDKLTTQVDPDGTTTITFETSFNTSPFVDEFRVLIDYGDYFIANTFIEINLSVGDAINVMNRLATDKDSNKVRLTTDLSPKDDSDKDGINDVMEREDDKDYGTTAYFEDDVDMDGIPSYYDTDSDGDGVPDAIEGRGDIDRDGLRNYLDSDDPEISADDSDQDGLIDAVELAIGLDPNDSDCDDDGLLDGEEVGPNKEKPYDHDGDQIIDALDNDDDNDTIPTKVELAHADKNEDSDNDGLKDWHDTDANDNGVPDKKEELGDLDGDGLTNHQESLLKTDPKNPDSDGDSLSDLIEVGGNTLNPLDTDEDSIINALDSDDDNDKISTIKEIKDGKEFGTDIDNDGKMNWLDSDADGDGKPDNKEGDHITENNKVPNYLSINLKKENVTALKNESLSNSGNNLSTKKNDNNTSAKIKSNTEEINKKKESNSTPIIILAGLFSLGVILFKIKKS